MSTSFLTREELHDRVDALFDMLEDEGDDPVAVTGDFVGSMNVHAPSESKNYYRASPTVGFAPFTFGSPGTFELGDALRDGRRRNLFGTVVVDRSSLSDEVVDALEKLEDDDADPEEIAAGLGGEDA